MKLRRKQKDMATQTFFHRGTEVNKIAFSDIEDDLEEKGFNVDECFSLMADEKEFVYVSNGFLRGLRSDVNDAGEWHHYFKREDGDFSAFKLQF